MTKYPGGLSAAEIAMYGEERITCRNCGAAPGSECPADGFRTVCKERFVDAIAAVKIEMNRPVVHRSPRAERFFDDLEPKVAGLLKLALGTPEQAEAWAAFEKARNSYRKGKGAA